MEIPNAPATSEMSEGFGTIPEGTYNLRVHAAEYVATPKSANAKGPYIKMTHIVTGPGDIEAVGRYVFQNYSLSGNGSFRLREFLEATGHPADFRLTDTDQVVGLEFSAAVVVNPAQGSFGESNGIRKHLALL